MISVEFSYRIGERVRIRRTQREGLVTGLMLTQGGYNLVMVDDGHINGHSPANWFREEELQRLEN